MTRPIAILLTCSGALLLASGDVRAQRVHEFNPRLTLEERYVDNPGYVDSPGQSSSDLSTRLALELPWRRNGQTTTTTLSYVPSIERYQDVSRLDRDEHRLTFNSNTRTSESSSLSLSANAALTQLQGEASSVEDDDLFLTRRTERRVGRLELRYQTQTSATWRFNYGGGGALYRYREITSTTGAQPPEDRHELFARFGLARVLSRNTDLGFQYSLRQFSLDQTGDELNHSLNLNWNHQASELVSLGFSLGGFVGTGDAARSSASSTSNTRTGVQGRFTVDRDFEKATLQLQINHRPSVGGADSGTSTNSIASLNVYSRAARFWNWRASLRYTRRDPTLTGVPTLDAWSLGGSVERRVGRSLALQLRGNAVTQTGSNGNGNGETYSGSLGLVWYPLGRRQG